MDLENIIVILAFVGYGIYSVLFNPDNKKKQTAQQGQGGGTPFGEVFPSIEVDDMDNRNNEPAQNTERLPRATPLADVIKNVRTHAADTNSSGGTKPINPAEHKRKNPYSMAKKTDAKRAFISSEIFNRKY